MKILLIYTQASYKFGTDGTSRRLAKLHELYSDRNDIISLIGLSPKAHAKVADKETYYFRQPFIFGHYLALLSDFNSHYLKQLRAIILKEKIDVIIMETEPYGIISASFICHNIPIIYDAEWISADMPRMLFKSVHPIIKMGKPIFQAYISLIERLACKRAKHILAISETDEQRLAKLYNVDKSKITIIPPFVDPVELENEPEREETSSKDAKITVVFHGPYNHPANREAFGLITDYIAPQVRMLNSSIEFVLAGMNTPVFEQENVKCLGFVADLQSFLNNADIAIVPLLEGTGVKIKVFDYMMASLPIIATRKALEGIEAENGKHAIIIDTVDQEFVHAIIHLAEDKAQRQYLAKNALILLDTHYSRARAQAKVDKMLADIKYANDEKMGIQE